MFVAAAAGAALGLGSPAAATPNVPPPPQARPLVITGAMLHTVSGAVIDNGSLRFEAGRIVAIGGPADAVGTLGAYVVALPGKHVYPGFISANSVLGLSEIQAVRATDDFAEAGALNPNARALVAVNPDSELISVTRANGVLAALAVPQAGEDGLIAGTSALVQLDGWTWEDMSLDPAVALHIRLPRMRFNPALFPPPHDARLDELRKAGSARLKLLDDAFAHAAAYAKARGGAEPVALDTRWEAMLPVLDGRRPVFVEADDILQIRRALGLAERLGSLEVGKLASFSVTDGDPFDIRTRVERVFIQGREVDLGNRQTRLADKYREKYRQLGGAVK